MHVLILCLLVSTTYDSRATQAPHENTPQKVVDSRAGGSPVSTQIQRVDPVIGPQLYVAAGSDTDIPLDTLLPDAATDCVWAVSGPGAIGGTSLAVDTTYGVSELCVKATCADVIEYHECTEVDAHSEFLGKTGQRVLVVGDSFVAGSDYCAYLQAELPVLDVDCIGISGKTFEWYLSNVDSPLINLESEYVYPEGYYDYVVWQLLTNDCNAKSYDVCNAAITYARQATANWTGPQHLIVGMAPGSTAASADFLQSSRDANAILMERTGIGDIDALMVPGHVFLSRSDDYGVDWAHPLPSGTQKIVSGAAGAIEALEYDGSSYTQSAWRFPQPFIEINGVIAEPTILFVADDATSDEWPGVYSLYGTTAELAGSGAPPVLLDHGVEFYGGQYYSRTRYFRVSQYDLVIEAIVTPSANIEMVFSVYASGSNRFEIFYNNTVQAFAVNLGGLTYTANTNSAPIGTLVHIMWFIDRSTTSYATYVDGVLSGSSASIVSYTGPNAPLDIGSRGGAYTNNGIIHSIGVWTRNSWLNTHLQGTVAAERFAAFRHD